jgi:hypothetical protein
MLLGSHLSSTVDSASQALLTGNLIDHVKNLSAAGKYENGGKLSFKVVFTEER